MCIVVAFLSWLLMRYTGMNVEVAVEASTTSDTENQGMHLKKCKGKINEVVINLRNYPYISMYNAFIQSTLKVG